MHDREMRSKCRASLSKMNKKKLMAKKQQKTIFNNIILILVYIVNVCVTVRVFEILSSYGKNMKFSSGYPVDIIHLIS